MARVSLVLFTLLILCCASQVLATAPKRNIFGSLKSETVNKSSFTTSKFCKKFSTACYKAALEGESDNGHIEIVHDCKHNGKKHSSSYTFGCKADGKDLTKKVLKSLGTAVPTATTTITAKATSTVEVVSTIVKLGKEPVPILQVAITPAKKAKRSIDKSTFCSAFTNGCKSQCASAGSMPKYEQCHHTRHHHYSLTCKCDNGKVLTQHALYAAASQEGQDVSSVSTSTSYASAATARATEIVTKMITQTATVTATSTTQIILATSGAVAIVNNTDDSSSGYVGKTTQDLSDLYGAVTKRSDAFQYMAVQDPKSKLYQLQSLNDIDNVFLAESGIDGDNYDNKTDVGTYSLLYTGAKSQCLSAGKAAGQPDGAGSVFGYPCETFIFGAVGDVDTLLDRHKTVNLTMQWWNPGAKAAKQYSWAIYEDADYLLSVASAEGFNQVEGSGEDVVTTVSLRFPA